MRGRTRVDRQLWDAEAIAGDLVPRGICPARARRAARKGQLGDPAPCDAYDVRALLSHIVGGVNRVAYVGEDGYALDVPARVDGVADDEWPAAFEAASARAAMAWADDAKLDAIVAVPWGQIPGRGAVAGYVLEAVTHGWGPGESDRPAHRTQ